MAPSPSRARARPATSAARDDELHLRDLCSLDASGRFANSGLGLVVAPAFKVHTADAYICTAFALVDSGWSNFASSLSTRSPYR